MNAAATVWAPVAARVGTARQGLAPLGDASAFSWPVIAVYFPVGLAVQVGGNVGAFGGPAGRWLLASAIGMGALAAFLVAARLIVCRKGPPGPLIVVASYTAAGLAQSLTFGIVATLIGATEDLHLGFRLTGVFVHVPMLTLAGLTVARHDAHRRIVTELQRRRTRLLALGEELEKEIDRLQAELSGAVRTALEPALAALDVALARAASGGDSTEALEALNDLVEKRVRPLSHGLAEEPTTSDDDGATMRPARVPLPARFRLADAIRPGPSAFAVTVVAIASAARVLSTTDLVVYLAMVAFFIWGGLTLVRHAVGTREATTPVGVAVVIALHALVALVARYLIEATGMTLPGGALIPAIAIGGLVGASTAGAILVEARREASEAELATVTDRLDRAVTLIRRRQHLVRRRLAFVLHGSLQGALYAAALRIRETAPPDMALVGRIRADVLDALEQIEPTRAQGELRLQATLEGLVTGWDVGRRVTVRVEPTLEAMLANAPDADEATAEVVREAVNNAFRHGTARAVEVDVATISGDADGVARDIAVSVRDDGTGIPADVRPGLGSTLFDELCHTWTWERDPQGTTFRALVAVG